MISLSWSFKHNNMEPWNFITFLQAKQAPKRGREERGREERGGEKSAKGNSVPLSLISSLFLLLPRPRTTQANKLLIRFFPLQLTVRMLFWGLWYTGVENIITNATSKRQKTCALRDSLVIVSNENREVSIHMRLETTWFVTRQVTVA